MVQDATQHGVKSRETGSAALKESWEMADSANKERTDNETWEWIPIGAISIDESILPRSQGEDAATIEQYKLAIDELPPITVQFDSLTLIGGLNRLRAHEQSARRIIKADVIAASDEELWEKAFKDNDTHGLPMTPSDRRKAGQRYMEAHKDMTNKEIASWAGVDESTVSRWRSPEKTETQSTSTDGSAPAGKGPKAPGKQKEERAGSGLNGVAPHGSTGGTPAPAPTPASPPRQQPQSMGELLDSLMARSPREVADETPDESVSAARAEAKKAAAWFAQFAESLGDREAELAAKGGGAQGTLKERLAAAQAGGGE